MVKQRQHLDYDSPTTNVLEVSFDGMVCQSPGVNALNHTLYLLSGDDDDYEEL